MGPGGPLPSSEIRQLMVLALEHRAKHQPGETFAKVPAQATSYAAGFRSVSNQEVWHAVNQMAWWLDERLGRSYTFETLAYLGPGDLRYSIILLAAIKTGYKMFYPSLRNSKAAFTSLLQGLQCKTLITTSPEPAPVALLSQCGISQKLHVPSLQELIDAQDVPHYPYERTFQSAKSDPVCVLHTSGSTGIPKPLVYTNEFIAAVASNTSLEPPEGFDSPNRLLIKGSCLVTLPVFHIAGLALTLFVPIFNEIVPVYPLPGPPPPLHGLVEAATYTNIDWMLVAPMMIQGLSQDKSLLAALATKAEYLVYIGGSPPREAGDAVAQKMPLYQMFGSSEFGTFPLLYRQPLEERPDWKAVEFHPGIHAELRHRFEGFHELVLVNKCINGRHQPVFVLFPGLQEYNTGDLFKRQEQASNLWEHESRLDDVIVSLTGEKFNPVSFEHIVGGHPEVRDVLMVGEGKFEASLLVERNDNKDISDHERLDFIQRIWPVVRSANSYYPGYAHVSKSKILLTDSAIPMARTGKGTVQRKATLALYQSLLDDLYSTKGSSSSFTLPEDFVVTDRQSVLQALRALVRLAANWDTIADEDDFFGVGMDSLIVHRLSQEIKLHPEFPPIDPKIIYMNPSISSLTDSILGSVPDFGDLANGSGQSRAERMTKMLEGYKADLDALPNSAQVQHTVNGSSHPASLTVLLTGSTGNVGSYLLDKLLRDKSVAHVFCLNRSTDSQAVQKRRNIGRGLSVEFPPSRVTFLTGSLAKPDLGISTKMIEQIRSTVTLIIHNAWPVDFNRSLTSFRSSLDGIVHLLALAALSHHKPALLFLSSISAVANYSRTANPDSLVPAVVVRDMECPANMGYGESKYLGELILDYASQKLGLRSGIVRVGQISGTADTRRGWNRNEWLPSLIISSKHIGALPETLGVVDASHSAGVMGDVDWIPIDRLNGLILDFGTYLAQNDTGPGPLVFHAVNPFKTTWTELLPTIRASLSNITLPSSSTKTVAVRSVPFAEWINLLRTTLKDHGRDSEINEEVASKIPGFKLLDFYSELLREDAAVARLSTDRTSSISPLMSTLEPVRGEWMAGWIEDWFSAKVGS